MRSVQLGHNLMLHANTLLWIFSLLRRAFHAETSQITNRQQNAWNTYFDDNGGSAGLKSFCRPIQGHHRNHDNQIDHWMLDCCEWMLRQEVIFQCIAISSSMRSFVQCRRRRSQLPCFFFSFLS
jgi:hypothetical protein